VPGTTVNVRYMVDDVDAAVAWYTKYLGFTLLSNAAPAFADVTLGSLRLLLSGPTSSAGRPMPDGARPGPGGWNRIHLIVDDLTAEVARLRAAGVQFRNAIVTGPGGSQILLQDPTDAPSTPVYTFTKLISTAPFRIHLPLMDRRVLPVRKRAAGGSRARGR
jgi:catechol 2,3-dioxygenase-like lactoylglutathione lyase family enzyme